MPKILLRFGARFLAYFLPLTGLWLFIAPLYSSVIFTVVNLIFQLDHPPLARVGQAGDGLYAYHLEASGPVAVFEFERSGLFFNLILLIALLLATPGLRPLVRLKRVALASALTAIVHVLFVVFQVKAQFVNLGLISTASWAAYGLNWLAVLFGPLGEGLFPLLIAGVLSWRAWAQVLGLQPRLQPSVSPKRNAPCPCGSGKKYKHCCGKT